MSTSFNHPRLPEELILKIIELLDPDSLANCILSGSKQLRRVGRHQYNIIADAFYKCVDKWISENENRRTGALYPSMKRRKNFYKHLLLHDLYNAWPIVQYFFRERPFRSTSPQLLSRLHKLTSRPYCQADDPQFLEITAGLFDYVATVCLATITISPRHYPRIFAIDKHSMSDDFFHWTNGATKYIEQGLSSMARKGFSQCLLPATSNQHLIARYLVFSTVVHELQRVVFNAVDMPCIVNNFLPRFRALRTLVLTNLQISDFERVLIYLAASVPQLKHLRLIGDGLIAFNLAPYVWCNHMQPLVGVRTLYLENHPAMEPIMFDNLMKLFPRLKFIELKRFRLSESTVRHSIMNGREVMPRCVLNGRTLRIITDNNRFIENNPADIDPNSKVAITCCVLAFGVGFFAFAVQMLFWFYKSMFFDKKNDVVRLIQRLPTNQQVSGSIP